MSTAETPGESGTPFDEGVTDAVQRLNERFYQSCPARYFEHRLNNLLVAAGAHETLRPRLREGIEIFGDRISVGDHEQIESELPAEALGRSSRPNPSSC